MYRASERCMLIMTGKGRIDKALLPGQFGVGVGVEPQIHFVRSVASRFRLDFRNAFNEVDSSVIINEVRADFPDLDPFTTWAYGSPARLLLRMSDNTVEVIMRQRGVQQECPFSPFLFSLAMRRVNLFCSLPRVSWQGWAVRRVLTQGGSLSWMQRRGWRW